MISKKRVTLETKIEVSLDVEGQGQSDIKTGIGFMDHMLTLFAFHSNIDLNIQCQGDLEVDTHHTLEDLGIVLGQVLNEALGDRKNITRYGNMFLPMDETLVQATVDLCTRSYLVLNCHLPVERVGDFECEMLEEFLRAFTYNTQMTLHINVLYGRNAHHMIEAIFKAMAQAIKQALVPTTQLMSTKGVM